MELIHYVNRLLDYWIEAEWYVALSISVLVNVSVFMVAAFVLDRLIAILVASGVGRYIDGRPLKVGQKRAEAGYALGACVIFALGSLITRELLVQVWPDSLIKWIVQVILFSAFYESYSYFVHRLLHARFFAKVHGVHHRSIRTTPWTAYSVHPVEAAFIALSAPLYMALFPMSLGVALILHVAGMVFTVFLHSNYEWPWQRLVLTRVLDVARYHSVHHTNVNVNFGFVNSFWDSILKTRKRV